MGVMKWKTRASGSYKLKSESTKTTKGRLGAGSDT
jgi:hypothetical protein